MFVQALEIARSKAESPALESCLESALLFARKLDEVEAAFESRINASKAARGEPPTRLTKAKREQIAEYTAGAHDLFAEQLALYRTSLISREIAAALQAGLSSDLQFWRKSGKHVHPEDLPVVESLVEAKQDLFNALVKVTESAMDD